MKKTMKFAAICAIAGSMLLFKGCTEEQSALNVSDVTTFATIVGNVSATRIVVTTSPVTQTPVPVPVSGRTVRVGVPNSNFRPGAGTGHQWFETTVNAQGQFTIRVPVVGTASVIIYAEAFRGPSQAWDWSANRIITQEVLHRVDRTPISVQAGNTHVHPIDYTRAVISSN